MTSLRQAILRQANLRQANLRQHRHHGPLANGSRKTTDGTGEAGRPEMSSTPSAILSMAALISRKLSLIGAAHQRQDR
ncbi:pentapeptide repeat-containing protein [Alcanivorax quisquiliarum]|uniref:pentapeptide repeat-containing protein n=1 Tax=Alcanivorax quisquiliarum TaxID=2933565 RepID=UPI00352F0B31